MAFVVFQEESPPGLLSAIQGQMSDVVAESRSRSSSVRHAILPLLIALVATGGVLATILPSSGPGVTCDEFDVWRGKGFVFALRRQGLDFFQFANIERNFSGRLDHPPLGRWLLGWTHHLFDAKPEEEQSVSIVVARIAPALAYGILILLVGLAAGRTDGPLAGVTASISVAVAPRMFGHAHMATLDTFAALSFVAALLAVSEAQRRGGHWIAFALAGLVWGLALLTKIHGLLVVVPVMPWLIWQRGRRAVVPLVVWAAAGAATFLIGWPRLWPHPWSRFVDYVETALHRQSLNVFYWGTVWPDRQVPWHYPWVMLAVTLPIGILLLGLIGAWAGRRLRDDPQFALMAGSLVFVLALFSVPGVPVYDGVRLFLMAVPLWAFLTAKSARWLFDLPLAAAIPKTAAQGLFGLFLAAQCVGLFLYNPFHLSYYNLLTGGLAGATRLGFETTYWGDTVDGRFVEKVARRCHGREVLFAPNLAPYQATVETLSYPELADNDVVFIGWDPLRAEQAANCRYAVVYRRRADLLPLDFILRAGRVVEENSLDGVWLSRLYELPITADEAYRDFTASSKPNEKRLGTLSR